MNSEFVDATGGDPIWFQHMVWLLGHPAFWLVMLKWLLVIVGVVWIAIRLYRARCLIWLSLLLCGVMAGTWSIYVLSQEAAQLYSVGRGNETVLLRLVGLCTDLMAIGVAGWIMKSLFSARGEDSKSMNRGSAEES